MNKQIKDQLTKVKATTIDFNDNDEVIVIPLTTKFSNELLLPNVVYLIELKDFIIHPDKNSTLASNWNFGKVPKYKYYKVEMVDKINNMVKVNGIAFEGDKDLFTENWYGWLPLDGFTVLKQL